MGIVTLTGLLNFKLIGKIEYMKLLHDCGKMYHHQIAEGYLVRYLMDRNRSWSIRVYSVYSIQGSDCLWVLPESDHLDDQ